MCAAHNYKERGSAAATPGRPIRPRPPAIRPHIFPYFCPFCFTGMDRDNERSFRSTDVIIPGAVFFAARARCVLGRRGNGRNQKSSSYSIHREDTCILQESTETFSNPTSSFRDDNFQPNIRLCFETHRHRKTVNFLPGLGKSSNVTRELQTAFVELTQIIYKNFNVQAHFIHVKTFHPITQHR